MPPPLPSPWTGAWRNAAAPPPHHRLGRTGSGPPSTRSGTRAAVRLVGGRGRDHADPRDGPLPGLPPLRRRREPALLHPVSRSTWSARSGPSSGSAGPSPTGARCSTSASRARWRGSSVCLPVLVLGDPRGESGDGDDRSDGIGLGEPLLFQWAAALLRRDMPEGATLIIGPLGMAAWFGLLLTALNLMPIGQLDGGHVVYALVRERALSVSRARPRRLAVPRLPAAELALLVPPPAGAVAAASAHDGRRPADRRARAWRWA